MKVLFDPGHRQGPAPHGLILGGLPRTHLPGQLAQFSQDCLDLPRICRPVPGMFVQ